MPDTTLNKLTDVKCRKVGAGRHSDGGGLYLNVKPTGAKNWLFIYRWGEKRPSIGLGGYPAVSLAEARKQATQCRGWLNETPKTDPKRAWKALSAPQVEQETFGPFAPKHFPAFEYRAMPEFWGQLAKKSSMGSLALRFFNSDGRKIRRGASCHMA